MPRVPDASAVAPEASPKRWPRLALRTVGVVAFVVIASVAARGRPDNGVYYSGLNEVVSSLVIGLLVAMFYLAVVGTIGYVILRLRHRREWSWRQVVFGRTAMIVTLVLLVASAAGRAGEQQKSVDRARPDPNGTAAEQLRANQDAAAWTHQFVGIAREETSFAAGNKAMIVLLTREGNTAAVRAKAKATRAHALRALALVRRIPDVPEADLNATREMVARAISLQAQSYGLYVRALRQNAASGVLLSKDKSSLHVLDSGDATLDRAVRIFKKFRQRVRALDKEYALK
jgi:hypothetical protein